MEYEYVWLDWRRMDERDARRVVERTRDGRPAVLHAIDPEGMFSAGASLEGLPGDSGMTDEQVAEIREGLADLFGDLDRNVDRLTAILAERHVEYEVVRDDFDWLDEVDDEEFSLPPLALLLPVGFASFAGQRALRAVHRATGSNDAVELAGRLDTAVRSQWGREVGPRHRDLVHAVAVLERRTGRTPVIVTGSVDVLDALRDG